MNPGVARSHRALVVVQARMRSQRRPGKVLADIGGDPLLALLMRRLARADSAGRIVLATSTAAADDPIAAWAERQRVLLHRGPELDVLGRYSEVMDRFPEYAIVVRVTGDNPFTEPVLLDDVVTSIADGADYADVVGCPLGAGCDAYRAAALQQVARETANPYDREHINAFFLDRPERFRLSRLTAARAFRRPALRLTVDTDEDLARCRRLAAKLPKPSDAALDEIIRVADELAM